MYKKIRKMIVFLLITIFIAAPLSILLVSGIDYMIKNHPNYKGKDLFNEEEEA